MTLIPVDEGKRLGRGRRKKKREGKKQEKVNGLSVTEGHPLLMPLFDRGGGGGGGWGKKKKREGKKGSHSYSVSKPALFSLVFILYQPISSRKRKLLPGRQEKERPLKKRKKKKKKTQTTRTRWAYTTPTSTPTPPPTPGGRKEKERMGKKWQEKRKRRSGEKERGRDPRQASE